MKVLYVARGPSPYRVDFFNELGKMCKLTVLFELRPEEVNDREVTWFNEKYTYFEGIYLKKIFKIGNNNFCPDIINYLEKRYDFIILGMYSTPTQMLAIEYLRMRKIPYALNSDGGFIKAEKKFYKIIKTHFISDASIYFSSSESTSKYLQYYGAKKNIYVYPFTTTLKKDMRERIVSSNEKKIAREIIGCSVEKKMILSVGQFIYRKGYDTLIEAISKLEKDYEVYVIGGKVTGEYCELCRRFSVDNIHFVDFQTGDGLWNYYKAADIFVLPTREDIWGLVINEAMTFGLPIITTKQCLAGTELVKDNINGYLINADNPGELAEKIRKLFQSERQLIEFGKNSLNLIQNYTIENMALKHYQVLKNLI